MTDLRYMPRPPDRDYSAIRCPSTGKLLCLFHEDGIMLYCRECGHQHCLRWERVEEIHQEMITKNPERA